MKKYFPLLSSLLGTTVLSAGMGLCGCGKAPADPYKDFRNVKPQLIFAKGEQALVKHRYAEAIHEFEALDGVYPFGSYAEQAQLEIIYAQYMNNDIAAAVLSADRYIRLYPRAPHVDYAYYMRGVAGLEQGISWMQRRLGVDPAKRDLSTLQQSFASFQTLTQEYPKSRYTPDALVRMGYIRNLLASSELAIARDYMERGAYVAAANRASYVVEHFQGCTSVPEALVMMDTAYRKLGMTAMADASRSLLKKQIS